MWLQASQFAVDGFSQFDGIESVNVFIPSQLLFKIPDNVPNMTIVASTAETAPE